MTTRHWILDTGNISNTKSYIEITGVLKYYWKTLIFWLFILEFYLKYYDFRPLKFQKTDSFQEPFLNPNWRVASPQIPRTLDIPLNIFSNCNLLYLSILLLVQIYPILSSQNEIIFRFKLRLLYQNSSLTFRPFMTLV